MLLRYQQCCENVCAKFEKEGRKLRQVKGWKGGRMKGVRKWVKLMWMSSTPYICMKLKRYTFLFQVTVMNLLWSSFHLDELCPCPFLPHTCTPFFWHTKTVIISMATVDLDIDSSRWAQNTEPNYLCSCSMHNQGQRFSVKSISPFIWSSLFPLPSFNSSLHPSSLPSLPTLLPSLPPSLPLSLPFFTINEMTMHPYRTLWCHQF